MLPVIVPGLADNATRGRGNIVPARGRNPSQGGHHGFFFDGSPDFPVEFLGRANASARGIDSHQDGLNVRVLAKFLERFQRFLNVINEAPDFKHTNPIGAAKRWRSGVMSHARKTMTTSRNTLIRNRKNRLISTSKN